jgi:AcrR family transcriptional regulator
MPSARRKTERSSTRDRLVAAAAAAFNADGFHGTDTNTIARAAGFAPQTFYRHFADKLAIFSAVYDAWERAGAEAAQAAAGAADPNEAIADAIIAHHRAWAGFRRSLRLLAAQEGTVRATRNAGRLRQMDGLRRTGASGNPDAYLLACLLAIERLADAFGDEEWADFGIDEAAARWEMVAAVRRSRSPRGA